MSYQFPTNSGQFQEKKCGFNGNPFEVGYSVQIQAGCIGRVSLDAIFQSNKDIANITGNFIASDYCIAKNNNAFLTPIRFDIKHKKYKLIKKNLPFYKFRPNNKILPSDQFILCQADNILAKDKDNFLKKIRESNKGFRSVFLRLEKVVGNNKLKIAYGGIARDIRSDKIWCKDDREKVKKVISSVNLLELLETKRQSKNSNIEVTIGPELASAQESLQKHPEVFFKDLVEVFGNSSNAILFYLDILNKTKDNNGILTDKQSKAFKNALTEKKINIAEENTYKNLAKELGIKVKHLKDMEKNLNAKVSRIERMNVEGAYGKKFKLILKEKRNTNQHGNTKEQEKFVKVLPATKVSFLLGDKLVRDKFLEKQNKNSIDKQYNGNIIIPDYIHISKKASSGIVTRKTGAEFVVTDFKKDTKIFLNNRYSYKYYLNPKLSSPEQKQAISQQLISALLELHSMGIYHHDFKPDNVIVDENKKASIVDLSTATDIINRFDQITTLRYSPPEFFNKSKVNIDNEKHDVWSLAVTLLGLQLGEEVDDFIKYKRDGDAISSFNNQASIDNYINKLALSKDFKDFFKSILRYNPSERPNLKEIQEKFSQISLKYHNSIKTGKCKSNISLSISDAQPTTTLLSDDNFLAPKNTTIKNSILNKSLNKSNPTLIDTQDREFKELQSNISLISNLKNISQNPKLPISNHAPRVQQLSDAPSHEAVVPQLKLKPELKPNPKPELKPNPQPKLKPEFKLNHQPEVKPNPQLKLKPELKPNPKPELKAKPKPKPKISQQRALRLRAQQKNRPPFWLGRYMRI
jgi:serine/threonine protein kinase